MVQIGDLLYLTLTLTLTLPDLKLSIIPSIPCLVSGRRSEPIIILIDSVLISEQTVTILTTNNHK